MSKINADKVPETYIRKQTLTNAERYITPELKEFEDKILGAQERMISLESEMFQALCNKILEQRSRIRQAASRVGRLDVICGLATVAMRNRYNKPKISKDGQLILKEARHPTLEHSAHVDVYVPNDVTLDMKKNQVMILTGPNMAGKSTFLRQVALNVILAQMGSFIPAGESQIPVTDRIFTRIGASDNLLEGQSTFMVEMSEAANILRNATPKSLVILDELGRGTSTFDGLSLAWAVVEFLHSLRNTGVKTLFATHYHELAEVESILPRVFNARVMVSEEGDEVLFLYKVLQGYSDHSYGIHVARLAGLPEPVIFRAQTILDKLESHNIQVSGSETEVGIPNIQMSLFSMIEDPFQSKLKTIDVNRLTPLDAFEILSQLIKEAQK